MGNVPEVGNVIVNIGTSIIFKTLPETADILVDSRFLFSGNAENITILFFTCLSVLRCQGRKYHQYDCMMHNFRARSAREKYNFIQ